MACKCFMTVKNAKTSIQTFRTYYNKQYESFEWLRNDEEDNDMLV